MACPDRNQDQDRLHNRSSAGATDLPVAGKQRLQRYLAAAGLSSRRGSEKLITAGRVRVNGALVTQLGVSIIAGQDLIEVDGAAVAPQSKILYRFNKPVGVLSTFSDPFGRTGLDQFVRDLPVRVFAVGRLDADACGLLLLTNEGDFAEQLLHPRYGVERVYRAVVRGQIDENTCQRLVAGFALEDGPARAIRAKPVRQSERTRALFGQLLQRQSIIEVVVSEGRKHFVKRLLAASGYPVEQLCRVSFGPYRLGKLAPGIIEELSPQEVDSYPGLFNIAPAG